jgi:hypothetical protein
MLQCQHLLKGYSRERPRGKSFTTITLMVLAAPLQPYIKGIQLKDIESVCILDIFAGIQLWNFSGNKFIHIVDKSIKVEV